MVGEGRPSTSLLPQKPELDSTTSLATAELGVRCAKARNTESWASKLVDGRPSPTMTVEKGSLANPMEHGDGREHDPDGDGFPYVTGKSLKRMNGCCAIIRCSSSTT